MPTQPLTRQAWLSASLVCAVSGALLLGSCQQARQTIEDTAKQAATSTGKAALAPAVNPVLDLLRQGDSQLNGGQLQAALATLGGFPGLWQKAAPIIQPLAGEQWPAIDSAAQVLISTLEDNPDKAETSSALSGLIAPLSALVGQ